MNPPSPKKLVVEDSKIDQQSALQTLKVIARAYPGKLLITLSLVVLENALFLLYPLFAGFVVDSIIRGDTQSALLYALAVFAFWAVGAARRAVDTRTFTRIYADLAVLVVIDQRSNDQSTSVAAARVVLAREFINFFEIHIPTITTALVSIVGAALMLVWIETYVGLLCLVALAGCILLMPRFARINQLLHGRINDRLEKEISLVETVRLSALRRHYSLLSRLRIWVSDREAGAYLGIGAVAAVLFAFAITCLATSSSPSPGHIYAVMTYLWTFVDCLDDAPRIVDQLARLKDIGKRVSPGMDG